MGCIGNCEICRKCKNEILIRKKAAGNLPDGFIPNYENELKYGISVDLGTTTVAASLWNLLNGQFCYGVSAANPQSKYGADVISRVVYDIKNNGVLHNEIVACINFIIDEMIENTGIHRGKIAKMCICGNTVMSHLFAGVSVKGMAEAPFTPYFKDIQNISAEKLGININGNIILMPNIASFVGADTVAAVLACGISEINKTAVLIDLGTNGEIVFCRNGKMYCTSTAAGPAFEGGGIKYGMKASEGAIESINFINKDISLNVIGEGEATGICGSGIIDIIAKLYTIGIIDNTGRIVDRSEAEGISEKIVCRIIENNADTEFKLSEKVSIYQSDIRALQLAKSAVYTGILTLLSEEKVSISEIENIYIAGAFGSYVNKKSALNIRLIPQIPHVNVKVMGNSAGVGAAMGLLSEKALEKSKEIAKKMRHIELSENKFFNENYISNLEF